MDDFERRLNVLEDFKKINQTASTIVKVRRIEKQLDSAIGPMNFENDSDEADQSPMSCFRPALARVTIM